VGVEQALYYGLTLYFRDEYDMSTVEAGHIVMAFGWCNTFARFFGGFVSDKVYYRLGMRGRIIWQTVCLLVQGTFILLFAHSQSLSQSVILILFAAIFMMAGAGSTFAIVPFVSPANKGLVSGVVSSGASLGAIIFSIAFRQNTYHDAFLFMGRCIVCSSILSAFIKIEGHEGLFMKRDNEFFSHVQRHVASGCYILLLNRKQEKSCGNSLDGTTVNTNESKNVPPIS
jgi:NNP family nitrate/nitrite transporter-like MFS transporter